MDIVISLIVGGVIGWLGSLVMGTGEQMGIIAKVVVGIVGSSLGAWIAPKLGIVALKGAGRWLVAVGGAVLLILILKVLGIYK